MKLEEKSAKLEKEIARKEAERILKRQVYEQQKKLIKLKVKNSIPELFKDAGMIVQDLVKYTPELEKKIEARFGQIVNLIEPPKGETLRGKIPEANVPEANIPNDKIPNTKKVPKLRS